MNQTVDWEEAVAKAAQEAYKQHRIVQPLYPWVLVRVLEREQTTASGIILPDIETNKPVHEGIVLATWNSRVVHLRTEREDGAVYEKKRLECSELQPGNHVIFPHWSGRPAGGMSKEKYRFIPEFGEGCPVAVIATRPASVNELLRTSIATTLAGVEEMQHEHLASVIAAQLQEQFLIMEWDACSVTLSGK